MPTPVIEAFSLSHAQILDGTTQRFDTATLASADAQDFYGVENGSLDPDMGEFANVGDDVETSYWSWLNHATVQIKSGYIPLSLLAALTGLTVSSSGAGATQVFGVDLYHESGVNLAPKPVILKMPSKDHLGAVRTLTIGLYKCVFQPINLDGPAYKEGLKCNWRARALYSPTDEVGTAFADGKKRVGKLISSA